jgi:membrane carboxypeptidase/penicillin-binding protein
MALGAIEATLVEITSAYAAFPNGGIHIKPTLLRRVRDAKGNVIFQHEPEANEAVSPQVAWQMVQLLRGVVNSGTAKDARALGRPVGGKTGTTDDYTDAWFVGFSPSIAVGVWTGYEKEVKTIGKDYTGARAALPIWMDFMRGYFADRPEEPFVDPGRVEVVAIDRTTGLVASEDCAPDDVFLESYLEDNRPYGTCSHARHQELRLPRCLQRFGLDDAGNVVVADERQLFELEANPAECSIRVDPIDRIIQYAWSPVAPMTPYRYRIGVRSQAAEEDSIEALMGADRRTTRDGLHSDFDVLDGRSVIVVRNDR